MALPWLNAPSYNMQSDETTVCRSDIQLPLGGELIVYSPAAAQGRRVCAAGCHRLGFSDVPASHAFTTLAMPGDVALLEYYHLGNPFDDEDGIPIIKVASVMHVSTPLNPQIPPYPTLPCPTWSPDCVYTLSP
jgi:hypothetical protein